MRYVRAAVGAAIVAASSPHVCQAQSSQRYNIQADSVSVSGISSGADLAHQLHVAHSAKIHGVGLLAASPYHCAKADAFKALQYCSKIGAEFGQPYNGPPTPDYVDSLVADTGKAFNDGQIDDPAGVKTAKIYLFSGTNDTKVPQPIVKAVELFYTKLGADPNNIKTEYDVPAGHGMVTSNYGNSCGTSESPYINKCGLDVAGRILEQIYGSLKQPGTASKKSLMAFDQTAFFAGDDSAQMDEHGHVYVPKACGEGNSCKLHVAVEGCLQGEDKIGDQFYTHAGYNEWAETNSIIILYPQVKSGLGNPNECWDWWGYTDSNYHTKRGKQVAAVNGMIDRILAGDPMPPAKPPALDPCLAWGWFYYSCKWFYR
jgi:poly(3-hydroxybutyrate) depolymerase